MQNRGSSHAVKAVLITIVYLVLGVLSRQIAPIGPQTVPMWLAGGLVFGAFMVAPRSSWGTICAAAFVGAFLWGLLDHVLPFGGALAFAAVEVLAALLGAWVATFIPEDERGGLKGLAIFVAGAVLTAVLGAVLAVELWRWQRPAADLALEWRAWAFSEGLGVLLIAPVMLAYRGFRVKRSGGMPMTQFVTGGLVFLAFIVSVLVVFSGQEAAHFGSIAPTLAYVPMPLLVITALLWGSRGGSLSTLAGALLIIQRTASGGGPFAVVDEFHGEAVIEAQAYLCVTVLLVLIVQALSEGRRIAFDEARAWRLRYERALDAAGVASVEFDAVTGRATWGEGASHVLGVGIESVPSVAQWHARIDVAERALVEAAWRSVAKGEHLSAEHDYVVRLTDGRDLRIYERLAAVRGPDGEVEQVAGLLRAESASLPGGVPAMSEPSEARRGLAARRAENANAAPSAQPGVLLIHGLGGTQYDLGSMHKRLKRAGFVTHSLTLPGHGTTPEELVNVTAEDWIAAVRSKYLEVVAQHEVLHVMGMCMGALLAVETVKREGHAKGKLIALAPPVYIDGWATPWYRGLRRLLYRVPGVAARMRIAEEDPFGIKNEQLRAIVKAKFERGENFHYGWVPLACIREVDRLRGHVMKDLQRIECQTLIIHARQDELTSLRSAHYLVENIGVGARAGQARMVVLEDSYHMVCVDNDRELVAKHVLEFFDASSAGSLGMAVDDPRMDVADMLGLVQGALADLGRGDFAALYERGTASFGWYQPGANRSSGIFRGSKGLARIAGWAAAPLHFAAFGAPAFNAGMAVVPATLTAGDWASSGVLAFAMRQGRLLEARWFPDDSALEDRHFGGAPLPDGPSPAEKAFEAAARRSKSLQRAPADEVLLALYALYKQGSLGDATGERPRLTDLIGRAKFNAWAARKGVAREQAMSEYVALVESLEAAERPSARAA